MLFGLGKKKERTKPLPASGCLADIQVWNVPQPTTSKLIVGDTPTTVYTYDAAPLYDADPDGFELSIAYVDGIITSFYTGTKLDTKETGAVIAMYHDIPIGSIKIDRTKVEEAARQGIALKVFAYSDGWLQFGSQQIRATKAKVPSDWKA